MVDYRLVASKLSTIVLGEQPPLYTCSGVGGGHYHALGSVARVRMRGARTNVECASVSLACLEDNASVSRQNLLPNNF